MKTHFLKEVGFLFLIFFENNENEAYMVFYLMY